MEESFSTSPFLFSPILNLVGKNRRGRFDNNLGSYFLPGFVLCGNGFPIQCAYVMLIG